MIKRVSILSLFVLSLFIALSARSHTQAGSALTIGAAAPEFELKDLSGQPHSLKSYRGKPTVVAFISARCPISNMYKDRIRAVADEYSKRGINFVAINSSADETVEEVRAHAEENKLGFTILKDTGNVVADAYAAERTPKVYVIDAEGVLRYQGRIDNSQNLRLVKQSDLRVALDELLAGKTVTIADTQAMGCVIKRVQDLAQSKTAKPAAAKPAAAKSAAGSAEPKIIPLKPAAYAGMIKASAGK
ncbi:MAG: thioredoxin family protein, partial [Blastocatellia bacterium]